MKCDCGYKLKISHKKSFIYALFGKQTRYLRCNNCGKIHSMRIVYHIVRDNADKELRKKNKYKTMMMK